MSGVLIFLPIAAFISFIIACAKASSLELRLIALGLALWVLTQLLPLLNKVGG